MLINRYTDLWLLVDDNLFSKMLRNFLIIIRVTSWNYTVWFKFRCKEFFGAHHWELNASCGGIPYLMTALRKAFLCRALNPSTSICPLTLANSGGRGRSFSFPLPLPRNLPPSFLFSSKSSSSSSLSPVTRKQTFYSWIVGVNNSQRQAYQ